MSSDRSVGSEDIVLTYNTVAKVGGPYNPKELLLGSPIALILSLYDSLCI